uniref:Ig-like domain-containing protein n=1 Tax=Strigamia maritima TaxID=126957 RepID=T1J9F4_STRMM
MCIVKQFYEVQVYDEFVIKGNIAVLKCHVPSFVRDHVLVAAWMRDDAIITHSSTGRITISSTGEMYIRDAGAKDSLKNYRCKTVHRLTGDVRQSSPGRLIITGTK